MDITTGIKEKPNFISKFKNVFVGIMCTVNAFPSLLKIIQNIGDSFACVITSLSNNWIEKVHCWASSYWVPLLYALFSFSCPASNILL